MNVTQFAVALVTSGAVFTFVQFLFQRYDRKKEKNDEIKDGLMCLLQDKLNFLTEKAIDRGEISKRNLEMITEMYAKYKALGGNGYVDDNFERCKELKRI